LELPAPRGAGRAAEPVQKSLQQDLADLQNLGIEGKKLLRPEDDFAALKDFDHQYEGEPTVLETMHLEYQRLLAAHPDLPARLEASARPCLQRQGACAARHARRVLLLWPARQRRHR
jgi:hypothetical protein